MAHNCHGKTKNLTAKTKYLTTKPKTSRQNQILHSKNQIHHNTHGKIKAILLLLWSIWSCREVFGFAVTVVGHHKNMASVESKDDEWNCKYNSDVDNDDDDDYYYYVVNNDDALRTDIHFLHQAFSPWRRVQLKGDVTRDDSQQQFLAQHSVATLLRCCFELLQHCSNIATLCCAKNRRCESSGVTSPKEWMSTNIERRVAHDERSKSFIFFCSEIPSSSPRNVVWFFFLNWFF